MTRAFILLAATFMIAACRQPASDQQPRVAANETVKSSAVLPPDPFGWPILDRSNRQVGIVTTRHDARGVAVTVDTAGLPPGVHGVHIHEVTKCVAPSFASAGPHWNWMHKQHGHKNPAGYHAGDLGNLTVAADGKGRATFIVAQKDWDPALKGGLPIVIHAAADDDQTDPSGNSGDRIACGIFFVRGD